jgi:hypothetical protein
MKHALIIVLLVCNTLIGFAQKNNLFADVGTPLGFSVTYNYKLPKLPGLGIGIQGYNFSASGSSSAQFIPAVFADIRSYHAKRKHLFFYLVDLGIDFYAFDRIQTPYKSITAPNDGIYLGFGLGYFRQLTKHGGGPYASLKFISNSTTTDEYDFATGKHAKVFNLNGTFALSVGFKF